MIKKEIKTIQPARRKTGKRVASYPVSLEPQQIQWLEQQANASERVRELIDEAILKEMGIKELKRKIKEAILYIEYLKGIAAVKKGECWFSVEDVEKVTKQTEIELQQLRRRLNCSFDILMKRYSEQETTPT